MRRWGLKLWSLLVDDWRLPFVAVTLVACAALFLAVHFFVTIQSERAVRIEQFEKQDRLSRAQDRKIAKATLDLCRAVVPTQAIYRIVLSLPPDPQSRATPEQTMAFRRELRRGVEATDLLRCENVTR